MDYLFEYGLFLAKAVTIVLALLFLLAGLVAVSSRGRKEPDGHIEIDALNDRYLDMEEALEASVLDHHAYKQLIKERKKKEKADAKQRKHGDQPVRKRVYVLDFNGDVKASAVDSLREEISAVLTIAKPEDEVVLRLESPGGLVHSYGLAASQLARIRSRSIPLTICVDMVAASGGYMMACIGQKILAAPFAVLGSIGVIAQLPNFHRLMKKHDIDFELLTAGEYKRTLTMFGENTEKGRQKFVEELEDTHELFKAFVAEHRPQVNVDEVATGEIWFGRRALDNHLIDALQTSDEYLMSLRENCDLFAVRYELKKTLQEKLGLAAAHTAEAVSVRLLSLLQRARHF